MTQVRCALEAETVAASSSSSSSSGLSSIKGGGVAHHTQRFSQPSLAPLTARSPLYATPFSVWLELTSVGLPSAALNTPAAWKRVQRATK